MSDGRGHYANPSVEDDLIDPDDGENVHSQGCAIVVLTSSQPTSTSSTILSATAKTSAATSVPRHPPDP